MSEQTLPTQEALLKMGTRELEVRLNNLRVGTTGREPLPEERTTMRKMRAILRSR